MCAAGLAPLIVEVAGHIIVDTPYFGTSSVAARPGEVLTHDQALLKTTELLLFSSTALISHQDSPNRRQRLTLTEKGTSCDLSHRQIS